MILFHCRWERSASRFARGALFSPVALAVFIVLLFAMDSAVGLGLTLPKRWDGLQSLCGSLSIPSAKFLNLAEPPLAGGTHSCEVTWPQSYAPPHSVSCRGAGRPGVSFPGAGAHARRALRITRHARVLPLVHSRHRRQALFVPSRHYCTGKRPSEIRSKGDELTIDG